MKQGSNSRRMRGRSNGKRPAKSNHFDSNGPEVRVRGTAQQVLDKYLTLARDADSVGDRVASENYYQHAEHYYRILHADDKGDGQKNRNNRPQQDQNRHEEPGRESAQAEVVPINPPPVRSTPEVNPEQAIIAELDGSSVPQEPAEEEKAKTERVSDTH